MAGSARQDVFPAVIAPTALALLLCNMDRIVMSVAILPIAKEFGWAPSTQVRHVHRSSARARAKA